MKNMVYVIGPGAIGKALANFLVLKGVEVQLVGRKNSPYLPLSGMGSGIYIVCTKAYANEEIALHLKVGPIILLQNGRGIERPFLDFPEVYRAVIFATAQEGTFRAVNTSRLGVIKGSSIRAKELAEMISTREFPFGFEENIDLLVWKKLIVNSAFNALCPLLEVDNGIFVRNEKAMYWATVIMEEGRALAEKEGVKLSIEELRQSLLEISERSAGQLISTYQDILQGKPTEVDFINGSLSEGKLNHFLADLIRIKSCIKS
jgi:2-dehydropantoate 2-reductase